MAIDWRKNELEFETPEGTVVYKYTGTRTFKRDKRKMVEKMSGGYTWEADGVESISLEGECARCKKRTFVYGDDNKIVPPPKEVVEQMGLRIAHFVNTGAHEPPATYCGDCVYRDNPNLLEIIAEGKQATKALTEVERYLKNLTAVLGGTR